MNTSDVFGVSKDILQASYVDRANLDNKLHRLLSRDLHVAIKGASKSGKTWLRQKCIKNAIVVSCKLGMNALDIYRSALFQIGLQFDVDKSKTNTVNAEVSGEAGLKIPLLADVKAEGGASFSHESASTSSRDYATSSENLNFVATSILESGNRLVIEDFHYLSIEVRQTLAHDLKALWDLGCFVIIIGVWTQSNLLTSMNPDLTGRIEEISVLWTDEELTQVISNGSRALNIEIDAPICTKLVTDSFGNVGILQNLLLRFVEDCALHESRKHYKIRIDNINYFYQAAKEYAQQLDGLYQKFATVLSKGIRTRNRSTGIYAYTMQAIVSAPDQKLIDGFSRTEIYNIVHSQESRIQKGNLKTVLQKIVELQAPFGNSLVISYDESVDSVFAIDRQLLFYRKHHTMNWPWEEMAEESKSALPPLSDEDM